MSSDPPNIILVTVDSLRADHCGCYGYEKETTPTLDAIAAEGVKFDQAISPGPSTPESMPAIFTSEWPFERRVEREAHSELEAQRTRIRAHMAARDTLAEKFQRLGYTTAAFTPNPFTSRHFGFDQGFGYFQDFMDESTRGPLYQRVFDGFLAGSGASSIARMLLNFWQCEEVFKPWESFYDEMIEWVRGTDGPYFLWVFLMDAHNPYLSGSAYRSQARWKEFHANVEFWRQSHETPFSETVQERLVTAYDDAIRYADAFLERLRGDVSEETVLTVHGDHGEAFGEHGSYGHEPYLYAENVRVPLVVDRAVSAETQNPVSLRRLCDILLEVASDKEVDVPEVAIARSAQGNRTRLYDCDDEQYIGTAVADGGEASDRAIPLFEGFAERQRIQRATVSTCEEGQL